MAPHGGTHRGDRNSRDSSKARNLARTGVDCTARSDEESQNQRATAASSRVTIVPIRSPATTRRMLPGVL